MGSHRSWGWRNKKQVLKVRLGFPGRGSSHLFWFPNPVFQPRDNSEPKVILLRGGISLASSETSVEGRQTCPCWVRMSCMNTLSNRTWIIPSPTEPESSSHSHSFLPCSSVTCWHTLSLMWSLFRNPCNEGLVISARFIPRGLSLFWGSYLRAKECACLKKVSYWDLYTL